MSCQKCGEMNLYADDTTISVGAKTMMELDNMVLPLMEKYTRLYNANLLKLNSDKSMIQLNGTHMELATERKKSPEIEFREGDKIIK